MIFAANVEGVLNTVLPALPMLRSRRRGQVALMSSLASFRGFPGAPAYCGSKAAVRVWGEGLRPWLAREGVEVSVICPGFVTTRMTEGNRFPMPFLMDADQAARNHHSRPCRQPRPDRIPLADASDELDARGTAGRAYRFDAARSACQSGDEGGVTWSLISGAPKLNPPRHSGACASAPRCGCALRACWRRRGRRCHRPRSKAPSWPMGSARPPRSMRDRDWRSARGKPEYPVRVVGVVSFEIGARQLAAKDAFPIGNGCRYQAGQPIDHCRIRLQRHPALQPVDESRRHPRPFCSNPGFFLHD